jgi:hypothetical protein
MWPETSFTLTLIGWARINKYFVFLCQYLSNWTKYFLIRITVRCSTKLYVKARNGPLSRDPSVPWARPVRLLKYNWTRYWSFCITRCGVVRNFSLEQTYLKCTMFLDKCFYFILLIPWDRAWSKISLCSEKI